MYEKLNQTKRELFNKNDDEVICNIHKKISEFYCIQWNIIVCKEWIVNKHKDWTCEPFIDVYVKNKIEFDKKVRILNTIIISINDAFCFEEAKSADKNIDERINSMDSICTQKLDEISKELK